MIPDQGPETATAPIFVDETGRRSRLVGLAACGIVAVCLSYTALVGISLAGGLVLPNALMPFPDRVSLTNRDGAPGLGARVPEPVVASIAPPTTPGDPDAPRGSAVPVAVRPTPSPSQGTRPVSPPPVTTAPTQRPEATPTSPPPSPKPSRPTEATPTPSTPSPEPSEPTPTPSPPSPKPSEPTEATPTPRSSNPTEATPTLSSPYPKPTNPTAGGSTEPGGGTGGSDETGSASAAPSTPAPTPTASGGTTGGPSGAYDAEVASTQGAALP